MINLNFLPSRRLAWYMAKLLVTRSLAVLIALVLVLMTLDLLGESGKILAVPGNGEPELWRYVGLRLPLLVQRFLPFAVLLGTLVAFTTLNQHSEVVAMKAAGLSAHQILAPMMLASVVIALAHFALNETVAVTSARTVTAWSENEYRPIPAESGQITNAWLRQGEDLILARHIGQSAGHIHLERVTIYEREAGELVRLTDVARAEPTRDGDWLFRGVRMYDPRMNVVRTLPTMRGFGGIEPQRFTLAKVDPAERDIVALRSALGELRAAGRPTEAAETGLWHKLSGPLSTILMPLLAAVAAFGLARSGKVLLRATIGMGLGFAYFVVDNVSIALGNVGAYPPALAAWAPFVLFLLIGETVLVRSEE
jgi:lipopolysaccharide export system permease protein